MATMEERIARTADDLAAAIHGQSEAILVRRPDASSWAAKEVLCHLRDSEELFLLRLEMIAAMDEPLLAAGMRARVLSLRTDGPPTAPDRWAVTGNISGTTPAKRWRHFADDVRRRSPTSVPSRPSNGGEPASIPARAG